MAPPFDEIPTRLAVMFNERPCITFVIPCMGRAAHVLENLITLQAFEQPVVLVDYSCPERVGALVESQHPWVNVVRVLDQQVFDISTARNAGFEQVQTPWVFFLDADIVLRPEFKQLLAPGRLNSRHFYLCGAHRLVGACGSVLAPSETVREIRGFDPNFHGYGGEDIDFFTRLEMAGLTPQFMAEEPLRVLSHSVADRVKHFAEKSRTIALLRNRVYGVMKRDLLRFAGTVSLEASVAEALRSHVDQEIDRALAEGRAQLQMQLRLPHRLHPYLPTKWQQPIPRALRYVFEMK